uniref:ATP-dependent Clp protease proteolytic subunit n=1 Tax=Zea mays TaxID=4577 RepID=B6U5A6_MAIZE|nr:hypothetical protein [Zea mays]
MAWLGLQLRVLVVRDPCAACRADARLSAQHFHHCDVPKHRSHIMHDHLQKVDKMFAAFTGQLLDMVQQWTERDQFMSSSEAMDFGLLDALLETRY